jgi:hypothetical protein
MDSDQKRHFEIQNLSVDTNAKYLTVSKEYRKDRAESINGGNNSSHLLKSNCAVIYHEEKLPFVSIVVPARNEHPMDRCYAKPLYETKIT